MAIAGAVPSIAAGYYVARVPAHILMSIGLLVSSVSDSTSAKNKYSILGRHQA